MALARRGQSWQSFRMGYRVANNYEEEAEREWRRHLAALPLHRRFLLRARLALIISILLGLPALALVRGLGLL